jgi:hypothetical protein
VKEGGPSVRRTSIDIEPGECPGVGTMTSDPRAQALRHPALARLLADRGLTVGQVFDQLETMRRGTTPLISSTRGVPELSALRDHLVTSASAEQFEYGLEHLVSPLRTRLRHTS